MNRESGPRMNANKKTLAGQAVERCLASPFAKATEDKCEAGYAQGQLWLSGLNPGFLSPLEDFST